MPAPLEKRCSVCGESYRVVSESQSCPHCLLRIGEETEELLDDEDDRNDGDPATASVTGEIGSFVGPYKLLKKIGEGGFGSVYTAEQEEPVKRMVALKMIKLGMDTGQMLQRKICPFSRTF